MDCREMELLIQLDMDHLLPEALQKELAAHLAVCHACAEKAVEYREIDAFLSREMAAVEAPAGFTEQVMSVLPMPVPKAVKRHLRPQVLWGLGVAVVAAAMILAAGIAGWFDPLESVDDLQTPVVADDEDTSDPATPDTNIPVTPDEEEPSQETPGVDEEEPSQETPGVDEEEPSQETPVTAEETPETPYSNDVTLPPVATSSEAHGAYSMLTLASYNTCDVLRPQISGNIVTYYIEVEGLYFEWQVAADSSVAPQMIGEAESLPSASGYGKSYSEEDGSGYSASSPDGIYTVYNQEDGLILADGSDKRLVSEHGGGCLLGWSSDSTKLFFSDSAGTLYLYYLSEDICLAIQEGVKSVCWNGTQHLVFTAEDSATSYDSLFRVTIP